MPYHNVIWPILASIFLYYSFQTLQRALTRRQTRLRHGCQPAPALPQRDPILGLDVAYRIFRSIREQSRSTSLKEQLETYGSTFRTTLYGTTKFFSIEPRNLQAVFATQFSSWGVQPLRLFVFEPLIGKGILSSDAAFYEHSRELVKPVFARAQITDLDAFAVHVERLVALLPRDGSMTDLQPLFSKLILDASTELLFGESVDSLTSDSSTEAKAFLASTKFALMGVGKRMQLPFWNILTRDSRFWTSCATVREFVGRRVDKILQELPASGDSTVSEEKKSDKNPSRYVLAHELAKATQDRNDIRNQLLNIFMPAHDAAAVVLTNVFFNLARHPQTYAALRTEVLALGSSSPPTFEDLKGLRHLQHIINETVRLYPPIGTTSRIALVDTVLPCGGGPDGKAPVFVRSGDILSTSFYALHRSKETYGEDAESFVPERWEALRPPPWTYLPFSGGPRVCPGQQLALTWVAYVVVRMVREFARVENRDPVREFVEEYRLVTASRNGAKVALVPA